MIFNRLEIHVMQQQNIQLKSWIDTVTSKADAMLSELFILREEVEK